MEVGHWISIGGLVFQILSFIGCGLYALAKIDGRLQLLGNAHEGFIDRLNKVDIKLETVSGAMIQLAIQESRMTEQDKRLQEISDRNDRHRVELTEKITYLADQLQEYTSLRPLAKTRARRVT